MREILFRGQTRRFGEKVKNFAGEPMPSNWVYGGVCCGEGAFSIIYAYMDEEKEIPIEKHVVYTDTIGQYTGLTDRNGKKIFEGDILAFSDRLVRVCWHDYCGCWDCSYIKAIEGKATLHEDRGPRKWRYNAEVIGNIHDNPELLKEDV